MSLAEKKFVNFSLEIEKKVLAWYAEFLLEIDLKFLLGKAASRLNFKIVLISLHFDPGPRLRFTKHYYRGFSAGRS
jgi:hypothetical protein